MGRCCASTAPGCASWTPPPWIACLPALGSRLSPVTVTGIADQSRTTAVRSSRLLRGPTRRRSDLPGELGSPARYSMCPGIRLSSGQDAPARRQLTVLLTAHLPCECQRRRCRQVDCWFGVGVRLHVVTELCGRGVELGVAIHAVRRARNHSGDRSLGGLRVWPLNRGSREHGAGTVQRANEVSDLVLQAVGECCPIADDER